MSNHFKKSERLSSRKEIESLFERGSGFSVFPFRLMWEKTEQREDAAVKMAISVPKRIFKKAVDRNLLKRRGREAYRINNDKLKEFCIKHNLCLNIMLIYIAKDIKSYEEIEEKIILILQRLIEANE